VQYPWWDTWGKTAAELRVGRWRTWNAKFRNMFYPKGWRRGRKEREGPSGFDNNQTFPLPHWTYLWHFHLIMMLRMGFLLGDEECHSPPHLAREALMFLIVPWWVFLQP
jgi:hypothetical protein